jgi:hypothetical protein
VKAKKDKYDNFCKVFAELSNESQDLLIKMANQLSKTHKVVKEVKTEKKMKPKKVYKNINVC